MAKKWPEKVVQRLFSKGHSFPIGLYVYVLPHFSLRSKVFNFGFILIFSGLHMKMDSIRESTAAGLSVTVRKTGIILNLPP